MQSHTLCTREEGSGEDVLTLLGTKGNGFLMVKCCCYLAVSAVILAYYILVSGIPVSKAVLFHSIQ